MALYKNLPRSGKKRKPDEFVSLIDHSLRYVSKNRRPFWLLLLLLAAGGLSVLLMNQKKENDLEKIGGLFFKASAEADPLPTYQLIVKKYPSYPIAQIAHMMAASVLSHRGKDDEAEATLQEAVHQLPAVFSSIALWEEAQLLWQEGKNDKALEILSRSGALGEGSFLGTYFRYLRGEILEASGKTDEAKALYEKLSGPNDEEVDITVQKMARNRLLLLKT